MQCPNCSQSDQVTIGNKAYCTNCGTAVDAQVTNTETAAPSVNATPAVAAAAPAAATVPTPIIKPAQQFHGPKPVPSRSVLDLSQATPSAVPKPARPAGGPAASSPQPTASPNLISKFPAKAAAAQPAPAPTPATPPDLAAIAAQFRAAQPAPAAPAAAVLPNAVATQIQAMNTPKPAAPSKKPASLAAGALAFVVMAGYIWFNNYPKLAVRIASSKAGFEAGMPGYLPSSYSIDGPISYAPGQIVMNFASPSDNSRVTLAERKTDWDSSSLLENYVSQKSSKYLAVKSQGLTIYVYNGNQASWVNRGVWYTLEGENKLNRDQVVKIASSL